MALTFQQIYKEDGCISFEERWIVHGVAEDNCSRTSRDVLPYGFDSITVHAANSGF